MDYQDERKVDCEVTACYNCVNHNACDYEYEEQQKQYEKCEKCTKEISAECVVDGCEFETKQGEKNCRNCGNLYWGEILDKFIKNYNHAFCNEHIRKPKSWALYQTWKLVDSIEKSRFGENENDRNN